MNEADGDYVYIDQEKVEINTTVKNITINTGIDTYIKVDKSFGPLCANAIRVHLDYDSVSWIVERERIVTTLKSKTKLDSGITVIDNDITAEWDEVARIDANIWEKDDDS
jgi:hypothetical protein